jgi:hypothetical protein
VPERPGRPRASLAAACVVLAATGVLLAPTAACTQHQCDPSSATLAGTDLLDTPLGETPQGRTTVLLQSTLYYNSWLPFPGNRTITVQYPLNFVNPVEWTVYVSTGPYQDAGATATPASGQLAQLLNLTASGFQLQNGSCADYYVYFTVLGTALPVLDAGADAASVLDSSADAPHD